MASLTQFLAPKLLVKMNHEMNVVDRSWRRKFLGYAMNNNLKRELKPAPQSVKPAKHRIREITHSGLGRNIVQVISRDAL